MAAFLKKLPMKTQQEEGLMPGKSSYRGVVGQVGKGVTKCANGQNSQKRGKNYLHYGTHSFRHTPSPLRAEPPDKNNLPPNSVLTSNFSKGLNFFVTICDCRNTYWWRYQNRLPPHIFSVNEKIAQKLGGKPEVNLFYPTFQRHQFQVKFPLLNSFLPPFFFSTPPPGNS
jgi:hypothetical protein